MATASRGWAAEFQDTREIRAAVQSEAARQFEAPKDATVEVAVGEIDSRLKLPACAMLQVELPPAHAPAVTAKVSCDAPTWTLYVPVRLHEWGRAVVAANNLVPNTTIGAGDLALARVDLLASNGALLTDPAQAEGKILRTWVAAGSPILAPLLALPVLVHRGQTVLLTLIDTVVTMRVDVVAMEDGRAGDSILVQNSDSKKTVRAMVSDAGTVEMRFGETERGTP